MYLVALLLGLSLALVLVSVGRSLSRGGRPAPTWQKVVAGLSLVPVIGVMALLGERALSLRDADGLDALGGAFAAGLVGLMLVGPVMVGLFLRAPTTHRFVAAMVGVAVALGLFLLLAAA